MSTMELLTAYNSTNIVTYGRCTWKPCCWLISRQQKHYLSYYSDFSGTPTTSTRSIISQIRSGYQLNKILINRTFFIVGLSAIFDEDFNLLLMYDNRNIYIKYGAMISSAKEKAIVKYLNEYLALRTIYVESFDEVYYNPTIKFKTRQEMLEVEEELTNLCKTLPT